MDDLELLRRRSNPDERISERNLAVVSKFMDGVKSDELKTMPATHFTMSLEQVPTPDDLRMKSREYLLIKPRAQNRYSSYGNYSGTNTGANYRPRDAMDKRRSCASCGSMDHHVSTCSTYEQNMKAIGYFLDGVDATDEDYEECESNHNAVWTKVLLLQFGGILQVGLHSFLGCSSGRETSPDVCMILMSVDGNNIYTKAHVTDSSDQVGRIYIGREELKVRQIGHSSMLECGSHRLRSRSGSTFAGCAGQTTFSKGTVRHGSSGQRHASQHLD